MNFLQKEFRKLPEVVRMTGLSPATIYRLAREGKFPRPIKLGERASAWDLSAVLEWMESRIRITDRDAA